MAGWFKRLQIRWHVSAGQAIIILVVFACTGFTIYFLKQPILTALGPKEDQQWWHTVLYYILILPMYNVVLLIYGFLFGQFSFFWEFEKRMFGRISGRKPKRRR